MLNANGKVVLYRFRCPDGKEHAMQMVQPHGFSCVTSAWYLNRNMQKVYVNLDELVEVSRVPRANRKPEVVIVKIAEHHHGTN